MRAGLIVLTDNWPETLDRLPTDVDERARTLRFAHPAPAQLNPGEGVWSLSKRTLANGRPDHLTELTLQGLALYCYEARPFVSVLAALSSSAAATRAIAWRISAAESAV